MVQLENNESNVELQLQKAEVFDNHLQTKLMLEIQIQYYHLDKHQVKEYLRFQTNY